MLSVRRFNLREGRVSFLRLVHSREAAADIQYGGGEAVTFDDLHE